jgi:hypothetical protein
MADANTFTALAPSIPTFSSFLFGPAKAIWWAPPLAKWWPRLDVPGLSLPNGAHVTELRGWIAATAQNPNDPAGEDDWHQYLEVDPAWLDRIGIDWGTFVKVGDIFERPGNGGNTPPNALPYLTISPNKAAFASVPVMTMEYCGWPTHNWPFTLTTPAPADWTTEVEFQGANTTWPFRPDRAINESTIPFGGGEYVRVVGSIVTDEQHSDGPPNWTLGHADHDRLNPARHTEIHPPDYVQRLPDPGRRVMVYAMAVIATAGPLDLGGKDESCAATFPAPPAPGPGMTLTVREVVGPESNLATITQGNPSRTGAAISIGADSVTVQIGVHGAPFGGAQGQFKAVYLLSWEPSPVQHVVYRGTDGLIHELYWTATAGWRVGRLSGTPGAAPAAGDPAGYMDGQTQHVVYRGTDGLIHELYWTAAAGWQIGTLSATHGAAPAAGDPAGYMDGQTQHVVYRGTDGLIHELYWTAAAGWQIGTLSATHGAAHAAGDPAGYMDGQTQHVVYRGVEEAIHELYWTPAGGWQIGGLTGTPGALPAAGDPAAYIDNQTQHVVYRGFDGLIHELYWTPAGGWQIGTLSATPGAAQAVGDPAGYMDGQTQHVVYRGAGGLIHELYWTPANGWQVGALSATPGAAQAAGDPAGYMDGDTQHVVYRGTDGLVHELYWTPAGGWQVGALNATPGARHAAGKPAAYMQAGAPS